MNSQSLIRIEPIRLFRIGAIERSYRRTPQRQTLALAAALPLGDEQRRAFECGRKPRGIVALAEVYLSPGRGKRFQRTTTPRRIKHGEVLDVR
jgi:hypothetical protein